MSSTVLSSREQSLTHYDVLGVSPTCTPATIEATFQSLISSLGDDEWEEFQKIEAAHHTLIDPQRRRAYDSTIGKTGPESPPVKRPPSRNRVANGNGRSLNRPAAAPFLITPDSTPEPSAPLSEPPADDPTEEPEPRGAFGWSRISLSLGGLVAVIAAAWSIPLLFGGSPGEPDTVWREVPAAAGPKPIMALPPIPPAFATRLPTDQGAGEEIWPPMPPELERGADQEIWPPMPPELAALQATGPGPDQAARLEGAGQLPVAAAAGGAPVQPDVSPQAGTASSASHAPAIAAPAPTAPAPSAGTERPRDVATVTVAEAKATPPRWISGGLLNSDNKGGRFQGVVGVRITVRPDGRAGGCRVTQSSGNPRLDEVTCNLVQQRLQFSSARDAAGRPIQSEVSTTYTWGRKARK